MSTSPTVAFDIRGPLPTPGTTTLLEASAGTGKTWTIAALVTRLVAEGAATLDELLVVTFGRAASQELRERVRAQLVAAERALDRAVVNRPATPGATPDGVSGTRPSKAPGTAPDTAWDGHSARHPGRASADVGTLDRNGDIVAGLLCEADLATLTVRRDRLRAALTDFDAATIATTHQFCQLVLRGLGVAGDTDSGSELVENLDDLLGQVVDDLYLRGFALAEDQPVFDRPTALGIARAAAGDPQARLEPVEADPSSVAARRRRFGEAVRAQLEIRKRRMGILSYDDLLSRLAAALADEEAPARERMRSRWRYVLVDEFQDTDPVQWQVLDRAFSGHAAMVLIGDPKQAIYAFRGGDVTTYLAAAETADHRADLEVNFRSDAPLVAGLHAVLGGARLGEEGIVVREVSARHQGSRLSGASRPHPFRLRMINRSQFGVTGAKGVPMPRLREAVATDLADDLRGLLGPGVRFEDRELTAGDIAVLCATRRQCEIVRAALDAAGVPAVIAGSGSVFITEGADAWLCLLEAMEAPQRSNRVRAAALTPFFGYTAADLDDQGEELTERAGEVLREWADLLRARGVAAVYETAVATRGLIARVLVRQGGERLMTDLRHVGEALHEEASRERLTLTALLTWMRQRISEHRGDVTGARTRRLDSDADAVQILTIHGSKGLQFPVVYLPFVGDRYPMTPQYPLFHDEVGRRCLDVGGAGATSPSTRQALSEEAGEDLRLLYVALTRAQSQVVAWWLPNNTNTPGSGLHRLLFGRQPGTADAAATAPLKDDAEVKRVLALWESAGGPHIEDLTPLPAAGARARPAQPTLSVRDWTRTIDEDWRRTSYSGLSAAAARLAPPGSPGGAAGSPGGAAGSPGGAAGESAVLPDDALVARFGSEPEDPPRADEPELPAQPPGDSSHPGQSGPPMASPMADLPVGATFGSLVHAVLEHTDPAAPEHSGDLHAALLDTIAEQRVRWPVQLSEVALADALVAVCDTPLGPLVGESTLRQIGRGDRLSELAFELPLAGGDAPTPEQTRRRLAALGPVLDAQLGDDDPLRPYAEVLSKPGDRAQVLAGYLGGSVDVVLRVGGRFVIVDYKTNWLGPREEPLTSHSYAPAALDEAMTHSSYPLQALLYAVVLHRFLRWRLIDYDPATHLGGVMYLYLRGLCGPRTPSINGRRCGVFTWQPTVELIQAISDVLDGQGPP